MTEPLLFFIGFLVGYAGLPLLLIWWSERPEPKKCEHQQNNYCNCQWCNGSYEHLWQFTYCPKCGEKL